MVKWWLAALLLVTCISALADAKKKWKPDEDFEFEEVLKENIYFDYKLADIGKQFLRLVFGNVITDNSKPNDIGKFGEKKRWIHDPNSDHCTPLRCKKKEICLLEDIYTAVCVNKKEIHKNGDIIISREKYMAEKAARKKALEDALAEDEAEDDDDDIYEDEDDDDDIFYDSGVSSSLSSNKCNPCPVMKPTFLCGSDNRTYSSLCRLDYHNCLHTTNIKVNCKGFCPCKVEQDEMERKKQKQAERMTNFMNKYKATLENEKIKISTYSPISKYSEKYIFAPEDFKYENKHYKYIKYIKNDNQISKNSILESNKNKRLEKMNNEVIDTNQISHSSWNKDCPPSALQSMGDRLLDWFSVIMADAKRRRTKNKGKAVKFINGCKWEVRWMYQHLDLDSDGKLSLQELYDLEHDKNEMCIKPFLDTCDTDGDIFVNPYEWCRCFDNTDRPCTAIKRRISPNALGVYVPVCDAEGYYEHTQCHSSVGMCWCVDKHGVEVPNSRVRGKPNCSALLYGKEDSQKNKSIENGILDNDTDVDDEDGDSEMEGSADQSLEF
ncbi:proteoglycan Cow isoform X3 [Daktulosphaira vitifoliae]|uniref:proteoglycan Cow isoform X3 n=1 Tax=Daktulosphaira vitifoliae TaxID=58002 RepID=UPI0021A9B3EB|nr:proteoglycan Cow isoform X3 [Daktulosphaira vitifoliae]